ncbi:hypothetical protein VP1G_01511 [Cytospora mali]|uniref:Uncharacterized protein n=1 Tax=Cytospora mali TaxID=578113 RepID=A0A194UQP6_CYTMA|nr:hypothetical protein VP1G_01511 [Valsa mali var. pyri (nom. inval.)]
MSLTSLSGGYGYTTPHVPKLPPTPKKPIFYDYSEGFESVTEPPPACPIAPIPKRVSKPYGSVNIQNNCDTDAESMDEAQHEFVAYLQEATLKELPKGTDYHGGKQEGPAPGFCQRNNPIQNDTQNPVMKHEVDSGLSPSEAVHIVDFGAPTPRLRGEQEADEGNSPKTLGLTRKVATNEPTSDTPTLDDPPEPETPALTTDILSEEVAHCREDTPTGMDNRGNQFANHGIDSPGEMPEDQLFSSGSALSSNAKPRLVHDTGSLPYMSSNRRHDSRFYSLGSGLSSLASFANQVERHFQTPGPNSSDRHSAELRNYTDGEAGDASTITPLETFVGQHNNHGQYMCRDAEEISHPPRLSSLRQHRRHHAELKLNTGIGDAQQCQVVSTRSGPTLVPQPISPAKILRVKNSIPQLMKALPPLPGYSPAPESPFGPAVVAMEFEPFELSRLTDARSTLSDENTSKHRGEEAPKGYDPFVFDRKARKPRLKLRHAASFAHDKSHDLRRGYMHHDHDFLRDSCEKRPTTAVEYSTSPVKRRLPIKISRTPLTSLTSEDTGTVKRRPGFQKSSTVSELSSSQPIDLFSSSNRLHVVSRSTEPPLTMQASPETREQASAPMIKTTHVARVQKVSADAFSARGSSLDAQLDTLRLPNASNEAAAEGEMQSFFSDNSLVKPQRGLRKRISDLKSRIAESRHQHRSPLRNVLHDNNEGTGTLLPAESQSKNTFKTLLSSMSEPKAHPRGVSNRKVRSTLEKFVKGAKHRLRSWGKVKRRID